MASSRSRMRGTCAAASAVFTVTRTISEPELASSAAWAVVLWASAVSVLVMDCTRIGASPPISACPTRTWRVLFRRMFTMSRLLQCQPRDFDLDIGFQIDRLVVVAEVHRRGVADHQGQRRPSDNDRPGAARIELRHQRPAVLLLDLDPGFAVEIEPDSPLASKRLLRRRRGGLWRGARNGCGCYRFSGLRGGLCGSAGCGLLLRRGRRIRCDPHP